MANIKQQIKRQKTDAEKRSRASSFLASTRTTIKKAVTALANGDASFRAHALRAKKKIDQLVTRGIRKQNYANRKKSQIDKMINASKETTTEKTVSSPKKLTKKKA